LTALPGKRPWPSLVEFPRVNACPAKDPRSLLNERVAVCAVAGAAIAASRAAAFAAMRF
jgi:hypothetical protein